MRFDNQLLISHLLQCQNSLLSVQRPTYKPNFLSCIISSHLEILITVLPESQMGPPQIDHEYHIYASQTSCSAQIECIRNFYLLKFIGMEFHGKYSWLSSKLPNCGSSLRCHPLHLTRLCRIADNRWQMSYWSDTKGNIYNLVSK